MIYKEASISSAGYRQKNEDGSQCIGLCYRRGFMEYEDSR